MIFVELYIYIYEGVRVGGLSPPLPPFLFPRGFWDSGGNGDTQEPGNVLLVVVVWCLRCNDQKEEETKDTPSESARGGFGSGKKK